MAEFQALVQYPDPVQIGLDWLRPQLAARTEPYAAGVVVAATVPEPRPVPLVVLRPAGGTSRVTTIDHPRLDAQIWHRDQHAAAALSQLVRALLHQLVGRGPVRHVRDFTGPVLIPDPESGQPRFLLSVELTVRGYIA